MPFCNPTALKPPNRVGESRQNQTTCQFMVMANTLNISLSEEQKGWLNSRRETGGFASTSDVVRDLIRSRQEKERAELLERFRQLESEGSEAVEPAEAVLRIIKRVKKERRA
jgi:Arc/MetJ-type ribon-helix-helix transcriptional regulator